MQLFPKWKYLQCAICRMRQFPKSKQLTMDDTYTLTPLKTRCTGDLRQVKCFSNSYLTLNLTLGQSLLALKVFHDGRDKMEFHTALYFTSFNPFSDR